VAQPLKTRKFVTSKDKSFNSWRDLNEDTRTNRIGDSWTRRSLLGIKKNRCRGWDLIVRSYLSESLQHHDLNRVLHEDQPVSGTATSFRERVAVASNDKCCASAFFCGSASYRRLDLFQRDCSRFRNMTSNRRVDRPTAHATASASVPQAFLCVPFLSFNSCSAVSNLGTDVETCTSHSFQLGNIKSTW